MKLGRQVIKGADVLILYANYVDFMCGYVDFLRACVFLVKKKLCSNNDFQRIFLKKNVGVFLIKKSKKFFLSFSFV
jgi:hypothetical protein